MLLLLGFITQLLKKLIFSVLAQQGKQEATTALLQGISILEWQIPKPSLLHGTRAVQLICIDQHCFEPLSPINIWIL